MRGGGITKILAWQYLVSRPTCSPVRIAVVVLHAARRQEVHDVKVKMYQK